MHKPLYHSFKGKLAGIEIPEVPINLVEEPHKNCCVIIIREDTYDHVYTKDPEYTETEKAFLPALSSCFESNQNEEIMKDSYAVIKTEKQSWQINKVAVTAINFGYLGDPLKFEIKLAYESLVALGVN